MRNLQITYRLTIILILLCVGVEASHVVNNDVVKVDVKTEQSDTSDEVMLNTIQPQAVVPVASFQINKWLYVTDFFSVALGAPQSVNHIEKLNLVLSYFEVLFDACIKVNAP